jgi:hypothetical protein
MDVPRRERLAKMDARLPDGDPVQIVVSAFQPLRQYIPAKGTEHGEQVGLRDILNFMGTHDSHRQNIEGVKNFFRAIRTKIPDNLSPGSLLPVLLVLMPIFIPLLKLLDSHYTLPPCKSIKGVVSIYDTCKGVFGSIVSILWIHYNYNVTTGTRCPCQGKITPPPFFNPHGNATLVGKGLLLNK